MQTEFDAIIIGTGQSGPALAARLSAAGMRVAIIERGRFGGTCVNTGCIPTKALVASAYAAHITRTAADYGVLAGSAVSVDMARVKARKDVISGKASAGVEKWLRGLANCRVVEGHARFESPQTVRVGDELLSAEKFFINVGGRALVPPIAGLQAAGAEGAAAPGVPYFTNTGIMDVDFLPPHLIIIGGSYIGLEFAQMYRRFGSEVTLIERGERLIAREDADVSDGVLQILQGEGVRVELAAEVSGVTGKGGDLGVDFVRDGVAGRVAGSHLLLAIGRIPNTDDLGLEKAGVKLDARGYVSVDDALCTSAANIWALGDCNGKGAFTHTSYNDYEIVADNLLAGASRSVRERITTYGLFIDPPLGRAGMTDDEIRKSGRKALTGMRPMARVGRAVEKGDTRGFIKITVDAETKRILGAAILGAGGDEAIHCLLASMYADVPYTTVTHSVYIHPTVAELLPTVLGELKPLT